MHETEAFVLLTRDFGESDRLVTFYSNMGGKITGMAKGARRSRRRFVHAFEPASLVMLSYREKRDRVFLEACKLVEPHLALRADILRWGYAGLLSEAVLKLTPEGEPQRNLFELIKEAFGRLGADKDPLNVVLIFLFRFMHLMGYLPALTGCTACGLPWDKCRVWWWRMDEGKLFCSDHHARLAGLELLLRLDAGALALIRQIREAPLDRLWRLRFTQQKKVALLGKVLEWVQGYSRDRFRSVRVVEQIHAHTLGQ
ncbi:MAG: DNA repair protein RecO [Syntrophobacteraceae bacterium]